MINIGVVCHSSVTADKILEFVNIFKDGHFKLLNLGKNDSCQLGTNANDIKDNILKNDDGLPFLVFVDMGSSINNVYEAKKMLEGKVEVEIADAPLLEGLVTAVTANDKDITMEEMLILAKQSKFFHKKI